MDYVGIEFTMKDGTKDSIDPVDFDQDFEKDEIEKVYRVRNPYSEYQFSFKEVESYRKYDLCPECGYEPGEDGCSNFHCSLNIDK